MSCRADTSCLSWALLWRHLGMEEADQKRCLGIGLILFRSHVVHITALTAVDCVPWYLLGCCTG